MHPLHVVGILTTLAAGFAYTNYRFIRLPVTIGLMLQSLALSLGLVLLAVLGFDLRGAVRGFVAGIDFNELLLQGLLCALLFSGALFVDIDHLRKVKVDIALFSVGGVIISTVAVALPLALLSKWLGLGIPPEYLLLFGALISPTDPITVLSTLKRSGVSEQLHARIAGEALFNDGVGIVLFLTIYQAVAGGVAISLPPITLLFIRESAGGLALGGLLGYAAYLLLRSVDNYQLELLITLALVTGGYSLATLLDVSGPLAMVVAGLLIGSRGRAFAMSKRTRENLDRFWELVEEMLNAVLYTLIGLEMINVAYDVPWREVLFALAAVPVVLAARLLSVGVVDGILRLGKPPLRNSVRAMTWGGVRGGIAIALALSLPPSPEREVLLLATYMVVAFSIIVQGGSIGRLAGSRDG